MAKPSIKKHGGAWQCISIGTNLNGWSTYSFALRPTWQMAIDVALGKHGSDTKTLIKAAGYKLITWEAPGKIRKCN